MGGNGFFRLRPGYNEKESHISKARMRTSTRKGAAAERRWSVQTVPLRRGIPLGAVRESGGSRRSVDRIDGRYPVQRWIGYAFFPVNKGGNAGLPSL
jgi:hypothetical protein